MSDISSALFQQMKLTILLTAKDGLEESPFHIAYLRAWYDGVCPILDLHAGWHDPHGDQFPISQDKVFALFSILANHWKDKPGITFYELEKELDIQDEQNAYGNFTRDQVVKICRYLFLKESFDESFWGSLCKVGECPVVANSIRRSDFNIFFT